MDGVSRRTFLKDATQAGLAVAASSSLGRFAVAQGQGTTRVVIDSDRTIAPISQYLFGSFLEHLGRAIYEGIYDPGSKLADSNGFRTDVMKEVHDLGVPIIRYPGGNFVSGYHWLDGVGPRKNRPTVLDRAWNTLETNQFGTNEFITWARQVRAEPLFGLNFGTGSAEDAAALVEYCNVPKGTKWSELRRSHGFDQPHAVKYWCVGNEMDGPWQIGHMPAREYGIKAVDAARQMRAVDPTVKLIACGSSGPFMPTYIDWDRTVLEECYDEVDGISLHRYWGNDEETNKDSSVYVAMNLAMDRQIQEIASVCDIVQARKRSGKQLHLSFDEWNVWYRARSGDAVNGHAKPAPHLLEEPYNLEDALVVGGLANSLIRHSDRVRVACLAQLINVIAPLMTNENGVMRQTIYYPYAWALKYARGSALSVAPEGPGYEVARLGQPLESIGLPSPGFGKVPYLDVVATLNQEKKTATLLVLNRDLEKPRNLEIDWHDLTPSSVIKFETMTGSDLKALNTFADPMLAYLWGVRQVVPSGYPVIEGRVHHFGAVICFLFLICGACRLARFNISVDPQPRNPGRPGRKYFVGMPIPAGAGVLAAVVHFEDGSPVHNLWLSAVWIGLVAFTGFLMVSSWRFWSGKEIDFGSRKPGRLLVLLLVLLAVIFEWSQYALIVLAMAYLVSGVAARLAYASGRRLHPPADPISN